MNNEIYYSLEIKYDGVNYSDNDIYFKSIDTLNRIRFITLYQACYFITYDKNKINKKLENQMLYMYWKKYKYENSNEELKIEIKKMLRKRKLKKIINE